MITVWLLSVQLRWDGIGMISNSKQQPTVLFLSSYCIPDFLPSLNLTAATTLQTFVDATESTSDSLTSECMFIDMNLISYPHKVGHTVGIPPPSASHMPPLPQFLKTNNNKILQQFIRPDHTHTFIFIHKYYYNSLLASIKLKQQIH